MKQRISMTKKNLKTFHTTNIIKKKKKRIFQVEEHKIEMISYLSENIE